MENNCVTNDFTVRYVSGGKSVYSAHSTFRKCSKIYFRGKEPVPISMSDPKTQRLKVTMVTWSMNDSLVVTAVSDHTLRVWDSKTGTLVRYLLVSEKKFYRVFFQKFCSFDFLGPYG